MTKLLSKNKFLNLTENGYVEYININMITILAALLYALYGYVFYFYAHNSLLITTQVLSIFVCIGAFIANRFLNQRIASITMILLVCISINIWSYSLDVGDTMRWYSLLALCPLYFFSVLKKTDRILLTTLLIASFLSSSIISYYHQPLVNMPNAPLFNTVCSFIILTSIALELILYKYIDSKRDNELTRMGTILENIECGIVIVDAQTHQILDINPVAERMYGDAKNSLIGQKCHSMICPATEGACPITDKNQEVNRSERVLIRADGTKAPIIKTVAKIRYNDRLALLESFTDITNLKEAEEKLRLLEITERANNAKSEFLSRMSHEMRTPMNAIIGMSKIAENSDDINKLKYCLSTIEVSSKHLLGIINDILDMSKIEAGKLELSETTLDLEQILIKVSNLMNESVEDKKIKLNISMDTPTNTQYTGDELRLSQVITNLMSNAVKFTHEGGTINLSITETQRTQQSATLKIAVSDTGIGMTPEQIGRLFKVFEQADGSITRQYGGTGLGLAISKNIVEKMGGRIWVESQPDKGSTFTFEINLKPAPETSPIPHKTFSRDIKTLIMTPDVQEQTFFNKIARQHQFRADVAENAEDLANCIEIAQKTQTPYDVILLSYHNPTIHDLNTTHQLIPETNKKSIIFTASIHKLSSIEPTARALGYNKFLPKPLFPSTVLNEIKSVIGDPLPDQTTDQTQKNATSDFSEITILLAEDVPINREIFIALLEHTHIQIDIAENGLEAVQKFQNAPDKYSAIIMDIQMPIMNGYEATRQIRSINIQQAQTIPIIAMTADAFKEDIQKCLSYGMNDHLKKPIELDIVIEKLSLYCTKNKNHII